MRILKKLFNFMFSRLFLVALMLVLQIALLIASVIYFSQTVFYIYQLFNLLSLVAMTAVVSNNENPSYKMTWIIAILTFPVIGWVFYLLFGNKRMPAKLQRRIDSSLENAHQHMPNNGLCASALMRRDNHLALQGQYIYNIAGYPVLQTAAAVYFPLGERMFERMLAELARARRFIFLEYFIIRPGKMWDAVFAILKDKVAAGVEVRMMYDDLGSINTLPKGYDRIIRAAGIHLCIFNPFRPRVSVILNYRDHRKIMVIDGQVAFCGGINLADEYINQRLRFGHWKDTGVMLEGDAAWPFTFMFLQQWQFSTDDPVDFEAYRAPALQAPPAPGLVQPFEDSPLDEYNVTETAYLNIISRATRYVYITTPYLVIDNEMENALCTAAQSGIDVRIITPHIYDKWYVHILTRSHYSRLIRSGVKVYEYTPGFMHGKMFVSDDSVCMVGTCNMDFRSFYLHFECSVAFYYSDIVQAVKQDMLDCQKLSHLVTLEESLNTPLPVRVLRAILKIFAPLM